MEEKSLKVLEWPKVKKLVAAKTSFSLGRQKVEQLVPSADKEEVTARLALTSEALRLLNRYGDAPFGGAGDIRPMVKKARLGGILEAEQLLPVQDLLYSSKNLKGYLSKEEGPLKGLGDSLSSLSDLEKEIERCIDEDGYVKDGASRELRRIRSRMRALAARIRERLDSLVHSSSMQKILQNPIITIRNGRYVVPVRSEYRNRFKGIVHDQSGSGATFFMEPDFAVELNNDLNVAEQEEHNEVQRILKRLSAAVAEQSALLLKNLEVVAELDCIFARARYSREIRGIEPIINDQGRLDIKQGRHPLLRGDVVPIDVWLGGDFHVLVITGPNTGGKTVSLKTVGLLAVMAQAGLHIPAEQGSQLTVFSGIYADIGNEQSIEQSLSTFSSHMNAIVGILKEVKDNSLVLLDELGAGTDPTEGAALAIAVLEHLRLSNTYTIATTHYSDLKSYAYTSPGVENASVEFDLETLRPTFRLSIGIPGKSNALAISQRLGLQKSVISKAQSLLSPDHIRVEDVIDEMETKRRQAEQERASGEEFRREYQDLKNRYEKLLRDLEEDKNKILEQARSEAQSLIKEAQTELNRVLGQARRLGQQELEEGVKSYREQIAARGRELGALQKQKTKATGPTDLKAGEEVRIRSLRQTGFVLEPPSSGGEVLVQAGIMKISVKAEDLVRIKSEKVAVQRRPGGVSRGHLAKSSSIRSEIDLRGKTVAESLALVDKYLDDAFLSSLARVRIIHGKGTGVLREAVQEFLSTHPHVRSAQYGAPNEGGDGVTVAEIHLPT
ncbi:MAG: endonuclease MutS2 [Firmicutes bacterium]|nr:endonuclease MutS2 [Bacillota bacterium]